MKNNKLGIGVLGAGQIAQAAHFESCTKGYNTELIAICDVSEDLCNRMAITHGAKKTFKDYEKMISDPEVDAIIIAVADALHIPMSIKALQAGKHVLCEKPIGLSLDESLKLKDIINKSKKVFQIGHMKRFDMGIQAAKNFIENEIEEIFALKAWYCDSTYRYAVTDAVQPLIIKSKNSLKNSIDPKKNLKKYYMLAHGSHLIDLANYLVGEIVAVRARLSKKKIMCWFIDIEFANGSLGHLDLTIAVRMDWHEGFQVYGKNGSILGKIYNPWLYKTSDVDIFREKESTTFRVLGEDGHFYRRQLESFADAILNDSEIKGATIDDGISNIKTMIAIEKSIQKDNWIRLDTIHTGNV